jgi:aldose 1-epimerase
MIKKISAVNIGGNELELYELTNQNGVSVKITNYGGTITSIKTPDRDNDFQEVLLGFDNVQRYLDKHPYFGSTVGRYANRIAEGSFILNGRLYMLDKNEGSNHLHGGYQGFDKVFWGVSISGDRLVMNHISPDGDQGYPGELDVHVSFSLNQDDELDIEYRAVCDRDTMINLTNHAYFNLNGCSRDILDHELKIYAKKYTPVGDGSIPTGEIAPLEDTPLDFSRMTGIGKRINDSHPQLEATGGYDHNYVLESKGICAEVYDPESGRSLKVFTDKPGLQFYSGNGLDGIDGRGGVKYTKNFGLCLETQFYPDSPNNESFSDCILRKGDIYSYKTTYGFGLGRP